MGRPVHRNVARLFAVGTVAVALGLVVAYLGTRVQGGGALPLKRYTYVTGAFDDVGTLKVSQKVTIDGVRVGVVSKIEHASGRANVTMRLEGHHDVYRDATLLLGNESALGRKYVVLDPGTAGAGPLPGNRVPLTRTSSGSDLNDVLSVFDERTRAGVRTLSQQLGGGTLGHGPDLQSTMQASDDLVGGLGVLSRSLTAPQAQLAGLIATVDQISGHLTTRSLELGELLAESNSTLDAVNVDHGRSLSQTLKALPNTLEKARGDLDALNPVLSDAAVALRRLGPGAQSLGAATPTLRRFLSESTHPLRKVPAVASQAEPATTHLTAMLIDARPVVPVVQHLLDAANPLLTVLAPYAPDLGRTVSQYDMLSGHFSPTEHYFSAMLAFPGLYNVSVSDPVLGDMDPYPGPGRAFGPTR